MRLVFNDDSLTEWVETDTDLDTEKEELVVDQKIRFISMSIEGDSYMKGLRLMNFDGETIVESSNSLEEDSWLEEQEVSEN